MRQSNPIYGYYQDMPLFKLHHSPVLVCFVPRYYVLGPQNSLRFLVSAHVASSFLFMIFFFYETMSGCGQNCWIDWNFQPCCVLKRLFHTGV